MITNIVTIEYDLDELKNITQESNKVKIKIYKINPLLEVIVYEFEKHIYINLDNNTNMSLYNIKIRDYNNYFNNKVNKIEPNKKLILEYKRLNKTKILISYNEKYEDGYSKVYISK